MAQERTDENPYINSRKGFWLYVGAIASLLLFVTFSVRAFQETNSPEEVANGSTTPITETSGVTEIGETESTPKYDGTVIWNGVSFENTYDNTTTNCSLGRVNTQYGILRSYIGNISTDVNAGKVQGKHFVEYGHGLSEAYPYKGTVFQTHVMANTDYMQFWHSKRTLNKNNCGSDAACEEKFTVHTNSGDEFSKNIGTPFLSGGTKNVTVILRGIDVKYGSSLDYVKKFQDAEVHAWLDSSTLPESGDVTVNISTNFNGKDVVKYDVTVYYTLVAFDPKYVSVATVSASANELTCNENHFCSDQKDFALNGPSPTTILSEDEIKNGKAIPVFVGLKSWGFDESSDVTEEVHRIRGGAKLVGYEAHDKIAKISTFGEVLREDCDAFSDGTKIWKTNELTYRVFSCKELSVCQAMISTDEFSEVAWTQKVWDAIKEGFETVFEAVETAAEDAGNWIDDNIIDPIEQVGDTISGALFPGQAKFPAGQVLVVLKEGEPMDVLTQPSANTTVANVYAQHGTPQVSKEFPYETQENADAYIETNLIQPYRVHSWLNSVGVHSDLDVPPLHQFYVLKFSGIDEKERDDIIEELSTAPKIDEVSANYLAKLKASPESDLYSSSLTWFQPYVQTWWPEIDGVMSLALLALMNPADVSANMNLLYPDANALYARTQRYSYDASLAATYYQFPGRAPYAKSVCTHLVNRPVVANAEPLSAAPLEENQYGAYPDVQVIKPHSGTPKTFDRPDLVDRPDAESYLPPVPNENTLMRTSNPVSPHSPSAANNPQLRKAARVNVGTVEQTCIDQEVLVRYNATVTKSQRQAIENTIGLKKNRHYALSDVYHYKIKNNRSLASVLEALQNESGVYYAEPNFVFEPLLIPNDSLADDEWHLRDPTIELNADMLGVSAFDAWDHGTGNNVVVAVLDSGVNLAHVDWFHDTVSFQIEQSNIHVNSAEVAWSENCTDENKDDICDHCNFSNYPNMQATDYSECLDIDHDGYAGDLLGWNFIDDNPVVFDSDGHGTGVAGVIGAAGGNGFGLAGINWFTKILPLKLSTGSNDNIPDYSASDILAAIQLASKKAAVVNMSFGGTSEDLNSAAIRSAITSAKDVLFVAGAGNGSQPHSLADSEGVNNDVVPFYPANIEAPNLISVASSEPKGAISSFSNYGKTKVHVIAPGSHVMTLNAFGGYAEASGTSFSAPVVSGIAALMYSNCSGLNPEKIKDILIQTSSHDPAMANLSVSGGIVNAENAINECLHLSDPSKDTDPDNDDCPNQSACESAIAMSNTESSCEGAGGYWGPGMMGSVACFCCGAPNYSTPSCSLNSKQESGVNHLSELAIFVFTLLLGSGTLWLRRTIKN